MDGVGQLFYDRVMSETDRKREREVEPEFPLMVLGGRIASSLGMEHAGERVGSALHWTVGAVCGAIHGVIAPRIALERKLFAQPVAMGMLAFDEFAFSAMGLAPPARAFPVSTHIRATIAHVTYGISLAILYEGLSSLTQRG
jgi:hypothetical protein